MISIATLGRKALFAAAIAAGPALAPQAIAQAPASAGDVELTLIGQYQTGIFDESAAEITAYDAASQRLFLVNANDGTVDILDFADPTDPMFISSLSFVGTPNSVAINNGLVAIALEDTVKQAPGTVVFTDVDGNILNTLPTGALPDMVTFTPDGNYALTANEGEPDDDYLVDPEGSVTIVDLTAGVLNATATQIDFNAITAADLDPSIRIFGPGASIAQDLEPEYIAVSDDSKVAFVACQENNAMILVNIAEARLIDIWGLGFKDHSLPGNGIDPSDRDDTINIRNIPVFGIPHPDAIAFTRGMDNTPYVLTANEGDARDYDGYSEEDRLKDLILDTIAFPNYADLQENEAAGRLNVTLANGDTDNDGEYEEIYAYGTRSFSIYDAFGALVYDSGEDFERITAEAFPDDFNSGNDENNDFEGRSDNKGPEPEGIAVGELNGRNYAFIGLERIGGIMVYDVTDPTAAEFKQYTTSRDFAGDPEAGTAGDLGPEGILYIDADDSPTGEALLVVAHEVSGSVAVYSFNATCPAPSGLMASFGAPGEATLSWSTINSAFGYRIRIGEVGRPGSRVLASSTNSVDLSGLVPGNSYAWSVRAACSDDTSAFALKDTFTVPTLRMVQELATVQVFPNPVQNTLRVQGLGADDATGMLYAPDGRLVAGPANAQSLQQGIDMSGLPAGAYHLQITSATGNRVLPVIKQ